MFGWSREEREAKVMVPQWLKIVADCRDLINKTVEPDVFFQRYELLKETTAKLAGASKYYKFKGTQPSEVLKIAQEQEDAATRAFILRSFQKAQLGADKAKTVKGKQSQFDHLLDKMAPYYDRMTLANVELVKQLHASAVLEIGGQS
nr:MAG TPA: hypothetical protein [Caudoviricetes sp.]